MFSLSLCSVLIYLVAVDHVYVFNFQQWAVTVAYSILLFNRHSVVRLFANDISYTFFAVQSQLKLVFLSQKIALTFYHVADSALYFGTAW